MLQSGHIFLFPTFVLSDRDGLQFARRMRDPSMHEHILLPVADHWLLLLTVQQAADPVPIPALQLAAILRPTQVINIIDPTQTV